MWKKLLIITLLFYLFALLQNSFFAHLSLFGAVPNLVLVFLALLVFFEKSENIYEIIFFGALAGFFLDIFSHTFIGLSVILLILIGLSAKKMQSLLKNRDDKFPFAYFLPIFLVFFIAYQLLVNLMSFDLRIIAEVIYNLLVAALGFLIFKKYVGEIQN